MRRKFLLFITVNFLTLAGCQTLPQEPAKINALDSGKPLFLADFPAERRGAYVMANEGGVAAYKMCAEPPADVGLSTAQLISLTADLKKADASADLKDSLTSTALELKGRTPAVLALRDVMYRMCEARLNATSSSISKEDLGVYADIVEVINKFAIADLTNAQEQKAKSTGNQATIAVAKAYEEDGNAALAKGDWQSAQENFNKCEAMMNGFRACYDIARAIRENQKINSTTTKAQQDAAIAAAILKYNGYLTPAAEEKMESLKSAAPANDKKAS